jgi:hypothetical protein
MKSIPMILAVLVAAVSLAADPNVETKVVPATTGEVRALAQEPTPMVKEILASQEAARLEIEELKRRYAATTDDPTAQEIMREIARVKRESYVEMMRIQLRYARERGDDEAVVELEDIVTRMESSPRKGVPVPRNDNRQ